MCNQWLFQMSFGESNAPSLVEAQMTSEDWGRGSVLWEWQPLAPRAWRANPSSMVRLFQ